MRMFLLGLFVSLTTQAHAQSACLQLEHANAADIATRLTARYSQLTVSYDVPLNLVIVDGSEAMVERARADVEAWDTRTWLY